MPKKNNVAHGGKLVERLVTDSAERASLVAHAEKQFSLVVDEVSQADLELLGNGALSPITGFMGKTEFEAVQQTMRLPDGLPWTIPIVLGVDGDTAKQVREGQTVPLREKSGHVLALLDVEEKYPHDAKAHAESVFGTADKAHPGAKRVLGMGDFLLAGPVTVLQPPSAATFSHLRLSPRQMRDEFAVQGWKTVVAFQTRNPIHRAHEYLMKCAQESVDGLLLHPLVGLTKSDDLSAAVRLKSYEVLLKHYFNPRHSMLAVFPGAMRYAGPREAVFHAILRKNYGCTHFIVGRDHAGVTRPDGTPYYGSYDAHEIFTNFSDEELGIRLFFYDHAFFCKHCQAIVTEKTAPPNPETRFSLSGTKVRKLLRSGQRPPPEITRPEVADVLIQALMEEMLVRDRVKGAGI
jgi:ATP sulfurylase